jgi:sulfoxide reductase heme-binding subunit YedZ
MPLVVLLLYVGAGLTANPLRLIMLRTGLSGLILLVASFACSPASRWLGWRWATTIRRPLGLYGFLHIGIHLFTYAWWETALDLELILRDLEERQAMAVGLLAFALLIPLAVTSTAWWQRKLGKRWKLLHRLIFIAMPLSVLHFYWLDRDFKEVPLLFAAVVAILVVARLPVFKKRLITPVPHRRSA